ncbi:MAG: 5'-nucleotidase C-terminal domain-containing protein, partial [Tissierellia bacterium]|nr:5'-nucleotidase C-terminal domain-containing protein [Tissierellia bacterium]
MTKKRLVSLSLALLMIFSLVPVGVLAEGEPEEPQVAKTLTIFHTNDVHGHAEEEEGILGYAKLKTFVDDRKEQAGNDSVVLLDAGDAFHGTIFSNTKEGEGIVELMKQVGYDAMVPGNHDYNYGSKRLVELADIAKKEVDGQSSFPILQANVVNGEASRILDANTLIERNGVKIGIFGLASPETKTKSNPLNTEGLEFLDYLATARSQVADLKAQDADVIIALVHLGLDEDSQARSDLLAEKVEGIDLIVDGHSHHALEAGKVVNDTLIVQAGDHMKNIGEVTLSLDENNDLISSQAKLLDSATLQGVYAKGNEDIDAAIAAAVAENEAALGQVVGKTNVDLDGERANVRTKETNLGNLIADSLVDAFEEADAALVNGGGIRASIPKGDITKKDVLTVLPFGNYPVLIEITGQNLLKALEFGVDAAPEANGKFPQVSGMSFKYDPKQAAGQKVFDVKVGGKDLDLEKTYKLAVNDFLAVGGDGYDMFKDAKQVATLEPLNVVLEDYIAKQEDSTVEPQLEDRIQVAEKPLEKPVFDDIAGHWAEDHINKVAKSGIVNGMGDNKFAPNVKISRAMIVTTLYRLDGEADPQGKVLEFKDVQKGSWYEKAVNWASANKIVEGYGEGIFKPNQEVTREEMAVILSRYLDYAKVLPKEDFKAKEYTDQDQISTWALASVNHLQAFEVMTGRADGSFDPKGTGSRAELAKVMSVLEDMLAKLEEEKPDEIVINESKEE